MRIVGLDPSLTGFGLAASDGPDLVPVMRLLAPRLRGHERLEYLLSEVAAWCGDADLAVLEGVAFAAKGNALLDLAGLGWMVRHRLWQLGVPYAVVSPVLLKQFATGSHQADKIAMVVAADRRFPELGLADHNMADALWLCAAGCQYAGQPIAAMPAAQVAVLSAVHADKGRRGQPKIIWPELAAA